jgi:hypothetical protein
MGKRKKKYCKAIQPFTFREKFYEIGSGIYLTSKEREVLIDINLIKK